MAEVVVVLFLPLVLAVSDHDHGNHDDQHEGDHDHDSQHVSNGVALIHGGLMLIAWVCLIPAGISVAKFCRAESYWLQIHRTTQVLAVLLTIVGAIVIIMGVNATGGHHFHGAHTYLGIVITVLAILQPVNAVMRPPGPKDGKEQSKERSKWKLLHTSVGYILLLLGIANCVLGVLFKSGPFVQNIMGPALAASLFLLIVAALVLAARAEAENQAENLVAKAKAEREAKIGSTF